MYKAPCALLLILATCTGVLGADPNIDSIYARCYRKSSNVYVDVLISQPVQIYAHLDVTAPTLFWFHDFGGSCKSNDSTAVTNAFLAVGTHNLVLVDASKFAALPYAKALAYVSSVSAAIAVFINNLVSLGLRLSLVIFVAFGLGAELAANVCVKVNGQIGELIALDPCGPYYGVSGTLINANVAAHVTVLLTDAGVCGNALAKGHVNFYPAGGCRVQPSCSTFDNFCSHHRSWQYYVEAVRYNYNYIGSKCGSQVEFTAGLCNTYDKAVLGPKNAYNTTGDFYLRLNVAADVSLWGLGWSGATCP